MATVYGRRPKLFRAEYSATAEGGKCGYGPTLVCSYILFCFSGLSKGHQQFTWEEGKIFSAKLVCFENFLALNCLPVESSQEVLLNWEKMFNFEA